MIGKKGVLFLLLLALSACSALGVAESDIRATSEETLSVIVPDTPVLTVNHFAGDLTIRDGEAGTITAHVTRQSILDDAAAAEASLEDITASFSQSGTDVTLDINAPQMGQTTNLRAAVELEVPPGTTLLLNQGAGSVMVEQPSGDVTINAGAGDFTITMPAEAAFRLVVGGGLARVSSDFAGVPTGGVATDIDTAIGDNPTQTLTFNVGAGDVNLRHAD